MNVCNIDFPFFGKKMFICNILHLTNIVDSALYVDVHFLNIGLLYIFFCMALKKITIN